MKVLVIGATSAIATATTRQLVARGDMDLHLVARKGSQLKALGEDLKIRGAVRITTQQLDLASLGDHEECVSQAVTNLAQLDLALICHGSLGNQETDQRSADATLEQLNTNALSHISLLTHISNVMEQQQSGTIVVISSVAGDRGRASNYIYGSAKAMVSTFAEGLRNRLLGTGVHVITVKPGLVDTPMTADFKKGLLWAQPEDIATGILQAIDKKTGVVYLPKYWRLIMLIIKHLPDFIHKRLKI